MADLNSLSPDVRALSFWLQDKIYREGIDGIHFMRDAQKWTEKNAARVTAQEITKELNKL